MEHFSEIQCSPFINPDCCTSNSNQIRPGVTGWKSNKHADKRSHKFLPRSSVLPCFRALLVVLHSCCHIVSLKTACPISSLNAVTPTAPPLLGAIHTGKAGLATNKKINGNNRLSRLKRIGSFSAAFSSYDHGFRGRLTSGIPNETSKFN